MDISSDQSNCFDENDKDMWDILANSEDDAIEMTGPLNTDQERMHLDKEGVTMKNLNEQLENINFRLEDITNRVKFFRAHQMRTIMDNPPEARNVITRVLADKTLASCTQDFSGALYLTPRECLTAQLGETISCECFRIVFQYPTWDDFQRYQKCGFKPEEVCGTWKEENVGQACLLILFLHCDHSKACFQLATINLELVCTKIIPSKLPWIKKIEKTHDSVGYYSSTASLIALVELNEYINTTGTGVLIISDTNTEPGEGKGMVDQNMGGTKTNLRNGRKESHIEITNARESVLYLNDNNRSYNKIYFSTTVNILEKQKEKSTRRPVKNKVALMKSTPINNDEFFNSGCMNSGISSSNMDLDSCDSNFQMLEDDDHDKLDSSMPAMDPLFASEPSLTSISMDVATDDRELTGTGPMEVETLEGISTLKIRQCLPNGDCLLKESYRSPGVHFSKAEIMKHKKRTDDILFPTSGSLDETTGSSTSSFPSKTFLNSTPLLHNKEGREQLAAGLSARKENREANRRVEQELRNNQLEHAHNVDNSLHPINQKWVSEDLRARATTNADKRYSTSKTPQERVVGMILEQKEVCLDDLVRPSKNTQFDDGLMTLVLNKVLLESLTNSRANFDSQGHLVSISALPIYFQLRLDLGWRLLSVSDVKGRNKMHVSSLLYSYNKNDHGTLYAFLKARCKDFSNKGLTLEHEYVDVVFMKSSLPFVQRGFCRSINTVSPTGSISVSDEVQDYILELFNGNSTMNSTQMRVKLIEKFSLARDQIPESTIANMIKKFSQARKKNTDHGNLTSIITQCKSLLEENPSLKEDFNKTALKKLTKDKIRAYLYHRGISFTESNAKDDLVNLRFPSASSDLSGTDIVKTRVLGNSNIYTNPSMNNVDVNFLQPNILNDITRLPPVNTIKKSSGHPQHLAISQKPSERKRSLTSSLPPHNAIHNSSPSSTPAHNKSEGASSIPSVSFIGLNAVYSKDNYVNSNLDCEDTSMFVNSGKEVKITSGVVNSHSASAHSHHSGTRNVRLRRVPLVTQLRLRRLLDPPLVDERMQPDVQLALQDEVDDHIRSLKEALEHVICEERNLQASTVSLHYVPGDGSCVIYAFLLSMWCQHEMPIFFGSALYLRVAAISLMKAHPEKFERYYHENATQYQAQDSIFYQKTFLEYCDILIVSPFIYADEVLLYAIATLLNVRFKIELILFDTGLPYLVKDVYYFGPIFWPQGMDASTTTEVTIVNVSNDHYWAINLNTDVRRADIIMLSPDVSLMKLLSSQILNPHAMKLISRNEIFGTRSSLWPMNIFDAPTGTVRPPLRLVSDETQRQNAVTQIRAVEESEALNNMVDLMLQDGYFGPYPRLRDFGISNDVKMLKIDFHRCRPDPLQYADILLFQANDIVMNEFSAMLNEWDKTRHDSNTTLLRSYCFKSQFATKLLEDKSNLSNFQDETYNFPDVCRWTSRINIFSLDILCFPVHRPGHWILIVVYMQQKEIHCYDHFTAYDGEDLMLGILHWISDLATKSRASPTSQNPTVPAIVSGEWLLLNKNLFIPVNARQTDGTSCGWYVIILMQYLFNNIPIEDIDYTQVDMQNLFRRRIACDLVRTRL